MPGKVGVKVFERQPALSPASSMSVLRTLSKSFSASQTLLQVSLTSSVSCYIKRASAYCNVLSWQGDAAQGGAEKEH